MSTVVQFVPSNTVPFQFQATLDGSIYVLLVQWNLYAQRYYLQCSDLSGNLIFFKAMIGSPDDFAISLTAGYFTSTLVFYTSSQQFVVSP